MGRQPKPEWFLAPRDIKPDTTIVLGKIITDPSSPSSPPCLETIPIDSNLISELKYPWSKKDSHGKGGKVGVFLSFLSAFGIGGDTEGSLQLESTTEVDVEELQIQTFEARSDYVQKVLDLPANVRELESSVSRSRRAVKPLYVITGVQIARGGTVTTSSSRSWSGDASVGVSPHVPGMDVGVKGGLNRSTDKSETMGKHDFVYAFKLNKVSYSRKTGAVGLDRYTKGAAFGRDDDDNIDDDASAPPETKTPTKDVDDQIAFDVLGVQNQNAGENEFGVEGVTMDGGEDGDYIVIDPSKILEDSEDEDEDEENDGDN